MLRRAIYGDTVSPRLLAAVERAASRVGLPLSTLELLGQDTRVAEAFVEAEARGRARDYLANLDVRALEVALAARRRRAAEEPPPGVFPVT